MRTQKLVSVGALLALVGCSGTDATNMPVGNGQDSVAQSNVARQPASDVSAGALSAAVSANNAFGVDLYAEVLKENPSKNLLTAPISASLALTMAYAGARDETKAEMASALHLDAAADDAIFAGQNALSQALNGRALAALASATLQANRNAQPAPSEENYQLHLVNSVWGEQSYTWEAPFLDTLAANYGTGVYEQDFKNAFEPARARINGWVSAHTNDKINELLPLGALDKLTRMVLVNAIHLKLPWASSFPVNATAAASFTRSDGSTVSVDFMHREGELSYIDDGKAQIVSLPLANQELAVVIALPHEGVTLAEYEATLRADSAALSVPVVRGQVLLSLPKVTFTSPSVPLADELKALGIKQAFDEHSANFKGLSEKPADGRNLYVSSVLQKSMIAMTESGIEAAAATAVVVAGNTSAPIEPPPATAMNVNRPYLLAIVDAPTGALLMLGQIQDPTDGGAP